MRKLHIRTFWQLSVSPWGLLQCPEPHVQGKMRHIRNKDGISEQHFVAFEGHTKSCIAVSTLAQINTSIRAGEDFQAGRKWSVKRKWKLNWLYLQPLRAQHVCLQGLPGKQKNQDGDQCPAGPRGTVRCSKALKTPDTTYLLIWVLSFCTEPILPNSAYADERGCDPTFWSIRQDELVGVCVCGLGQ